MSHPQQPYNRHLYLVKPGHAPPIKLAPVMMKILNLSHNRPLTMQLSPAGLKEALELQSIVKDELNNLDGEGNFKNPVIRNTIERLCSIIR